MDILEIWVDDLISFRRFRNAFGQPFVTPNLDALCADACVFDNAYAAIPICNPSRTAAQTGYSFVDTGITDNNNGWQSRIRPEQTWLYKIRQQGYRITTAGKIFHGDGPQPQSVYDVLYDDAERFTWGYGTHNPDLPYIDYGGQVSGLSAGKGFTEGEEQLYDYLTASYAIDRINEWDASGKNYHQIGFHHPHAPFHSPARFFENIDLNDIILPTEWEGGWDLLPFQQQLYEYWGEFSGPTITWDEPKIDLWKRLVRGYMAGTTWMDEQFGRVRDHLIATGRYDTTIILLVSDHGFHLADHGGKIAKWTLFEAACLAPLIVRDPSQTPRVITDPVSLMDVGPTLLDYAGGDPVTPDRIGQSLRPVVEGGTSDPNRLVPSFYYQGSISARFGDHRLTVFADGSSTYYDLATDFWELDQLPTSGSVFESRRAALLEEAIKWGVQFVENGMRVDRPTGFTAYLGENLPDVRVTPGSYISMGDVTARATVHGYQQFVTGSTEGGTAIKLPPHVDDLYFVIPGGGAWGQNWNLTFNDLNNEFQVRSGGGGKDVFIDLGGGDDTVRSNNNRMTVYGRDGNDRISFGNPSSFADGGRGNDTISGGNSADTIYGGAGDDRLTGGSGADTIHGGPGNDYIHGGPGADTIHIDGGVDEVWGGSEANTFIVHRTGDVSTIKDLKSADTLDLSDWAGIQPVSVVQSGSDVIVSAALERLVCQNIDAATVTGTITGATVA